MLTMIKKKEKDENLIIFWINNHFRPEMCMTLTYSFLNVYDADIFIHEFVT